MVISVIVYGEIPTFAKDSYILLQQGANVIKPVHVRFDAVAHRLPVWPENSRFVVKVMGSYRNSGFSPLGETEILIYPGQGGKISFDVDFSQIP